MMVPLMLWIGNRSFGISANLRHMCAIAQPKSVGVEFFQYNWREQSWSLVFAGGAVLGGFFAGIVFANPEPVDLSVAALTMFSNWNVPIAGGFLPPVLFDFTWMSIIVMFVGGVLVGFGTRYASGSTSGHAITGLSTLQLQSLLAVAFAQYMGNVDTESGKTGKNTIEEALKLQRERVESAQANPSTGSGTPYLAADGVLGASAIAAAVFGGIAAAFFFRGRTGRYAAQGRG